MRITVNGEARTCTDDRSLLDLVLELGLPPENVVVEHNLSLVPAALFAKTPLHEGDTLEILHFVGGG